MAWILLFRKRRQTEANLILIPFYKAPFIGKDFLFSGFFGLLVLLVSSCGKQEMIESEPKDPVEKIVTPPYLPKEYTSFRNFSVNEGLPENSALSLLVDEEGFLWVGTQNGIGRFENNGFRAYYYLEDDASSVFSEENRVYLDFKGRVCSRGAYGVTIYDPLTDSFRRIESPVSDSSTRQKCFIDEKENLWMLSRYDAGMEIRMFQHTEEKLSEQYPRAKAGNFVQTKDGTLYCILDFIHRREVIHLSGGNKGINTTPLIIDGSYYLNNNALNFHGDRVLLLEDDEFIVWMGENDFYKVDGSKTEELSLLSDSSKVIADLRFYENLDHNVHYLIAQYEDISFELFRFYTDGDSIRSCGTHDGSLVNGAVNSVGDFTFLLNPFEDGNHEHLLGNYLRAEDTTHFIASNLPDLMYGSVHRSLSAKYDRMDNLWIGTHNMGVNVYSPVDQGFREKTPASISNEQKGQRYFPLYSSEDTTVIMSESGTIFPGLGRKPIELQNDDIYVWGYRNYNGRILISAGLAGCILYDTKKNTVEIIDLGKLRMDYPSFRLINSRIDSKGRLWAMGPNGLFKMEPKGTSFDRSNWELYQEDSNSVYRRRLRSNMIEDVFEVGNQLYATTQDPRKLLVYNEGADTFEIAQTTDNIWGRRAFRVEDELWLTSLFHGFMKIDTVDMSISAKYNRENGALPESWIQMHTSLGSQEILWRGETKQWYIFNHRTGENHPLNQYEDHDYALSSLPAVYNQHSFQLLPGTDCIYEYDINFVDELERHQIVLDRLYVNKKDVSSRLPGRLCDQELIELPYDENNLQIVFKDQIPQERNHLFYEFQLEGRDTKWRSNEELRVSYPELAPGEYTFKVRLASKLNGQSSKPVTLKINILKPFYLTAGAMTLYFFGFIFSIFSVTRARTRKLRKKQIELQAIIQEKTRDITLQKEDLEEKQKEILDSINYAKRIQSAILPQDDHWLNFLPQSFVLYQPKDIVAGDFYWMQHDRERIYFASADCTGHGVPGAMVSVVCNNSLNKAVNQHGLKKAGEILDKTRQIVIAEFEQSAEGVKDGMDIAFCSISRSSEQKGTTLLEYAGAHNPLWIIRKKGPETEDIKSEFAPGTKIEESDDYLFIEIKADKQPIGVHVSTDSFQTHEVELREGDTIYLFSDGFADQFGGKKGKKFKTANFKKLLLSIQDQPIQQHQQILLNAFEEWRGELEQLDDVCVIGVRF